MVKKNNRSTPSVPVRESAFRVLAATVLLLVIALALSIPYIYETETLWYKIGIDKIMLRTGQMAGLLTAVLLFVQVLLAIRTELMRKHFGVSFLMRLHRGNGMLLCCLAISHMLLILLPEGLTNLPIGLKYWPQLVGALLLCTIVIMVISAQFRQQLHLGYKRWRISHQLAAYLVIILVVIHVIFVSESFEHGVPRASLLLLAAGVALVVVVSKIKSRPKPAR